MRPKRTQFGMRKTSASPRRFVLRLVMYSFPPDFFKQLAASFEDTQPPLPDPRTVETFDLPFTDAENGATGGRSLDAAGLRSLHKMFLLLDKWDQVAQADPESTKISSKERETSR